MTTARRYVSPLRYPGGKATMAPWLAEAFAAQGGLMDIEIWLEPFAGGAGAALTLLDRGDISEAWLVDQNPGIAAFWATVTGEGETLAALVERTTPTLDLFDRSKATLAAPAGMDPFRLGYAAFIVNRCSRSGIVAPNVGPMGGRKPTGEWGIGARFNAPALADRIRHVASFAPRLRTHHGDGISFLEDLNDSGVADEVLAFVDPPYVREGERLYTNGFDAAAHQRLADALNGTCARWILTYDDEPVVADTLYPDRRVLAYDIRNTANRARVAQEYAVFSDNLNLPSATALTEGRGTSWVREAA